MDDLGLFENLKLATRQRISQTPSDLDRTFTNEEFLIDNLSILAPLSKGGRVVIAFNFISKTELKHLTNNGRWNFKRLDVLTWQVNLQQVDWEAHPKLDVDSHWDFLLHKILRATK